MAAENHFIVVVPGYMGSLLRDKSSGRIVWLDVPGLLARPLEIVETLEKMRFPNDDLEPAGIMQRGVLYVLPWARLDHYGRLLDHLKRAGYTVDPPVPDPARKTVYTFPYDWRQDNRVSARQLGQAVRAWRDKHDDAKAWLIGHSNGGIISRWFIEKEGGKDDVERLFLMGSPWDGAPKALRVLFDGYDVVGRKLLNLLGVNRRIGELIRSFPSYYQLIPGTNPFLTDDQNRPVNPFDPPGWLDGDAERAMLLDGLQFNRDLGNSLSVDTVCYFGRTKPTTTSGVISLAPGGKWSRIQWVDTPGGDGTVPERSAVFPQAREKHAYAVGHGEIYVAEAVLTQLDFDLGRRPGGLEVTVVLAKLIVEFETDKDFYEPGETVQVHVALQDRKAPGGPVTGAGVKVTVRWREPLPGDEGAEAQGDALEIDLPAAPAQPGMYRAEFPAPQAEGFYTLVAAIDTPLQPNLRVEETLAVEKERHEVRITEKGDLLWDS